MLQSAVTYKAGVLSVWSTGTELNELLSARLLHTFTFTCICFDLKHWKQRVKPESCSPVWYSGPEGHF